jgi:hypothetical protein
MGVVLDVPPNSGNSITLWSEAEREVHLAETAKADDRIELLENALRGIIDHWWEFGEMMMTNADTYGFDETIDAAAKLVK